MIRLLTQQDYDIVQSYLDKDPLNNVYLIHGLQTYGLESKRVTFWGAFNNDRLEGVLLVDYGRSRTGFLAGDNPEILAQLGKCALEANTNRFFGKSEYIQPVVAAIENSYPQIEVQQAPAHHLFEIHPGQAVGHYDYPVRTATRDDVPLLMELYQDDERSQTHLEHAIREAIDRSACFFIEVEGRAVSAVRVDQETDQAGMMKTGATLPEFRGRGMYPSVLTACIEYLSKQGKVALGTVDDANIAMHRVAEKCGGSFTAPWSYIHFKKSPSLRQRILRRLRRWGLRIRDKISRQ